MEDWYVLRTMCGKEEKVATIFKKIFSQFEVIYPKRKISWRKNGKIISIVRPLFEGYLFVSTNKDNIRQLSYLLRKHNVNIAWLVSSAGSVEPILVEEKQLIQKLMGREGIVEVSEIHRIEDRFEVVKGPLLGLDHIIKKFTNRNRRITIEIAILEEKKKIELEGILNNA